MPRPDGSIFVGRLSKNTRTRDLEEIFEPYGRLLRCDIKYGTELAYAFIDFEDRQEAEDCVKYENGRQLNGQSITVEWAKGGKDKRLGYDECFRCHRTGHWARDCPELWGGRRGGGGRGRGRRWSPAPRQRRSRSRDRRRRSRSRSDDRHKRSSSRDRKRSRSPSSRSRSGSRKSRSESVDRKKDTRYKSRSRERKSNGSGSKSRSRSKSGSKSRSRSRTPKQRPESNARDQFNGESSKDDRDNDRGGGYDNDEGREARGSSED